LEKNAFEKILNIDLIIAGIAMLVLIFVTFAAVILRYCVRKPLIWGEEMQLFCFVWAALFGSGAVFRNGGHVAIDILVDLFPPKIQKIVESVVYVIVVGILAFLFWQSFLLTKQMYTTNRVTNILRIPYWIVYGAMPAGCVLMILNHGIAVYRKLRG